ncbi:MAG: GerMN domain-containing protein [Candidatus Nanopelagicales bacterium]
MKRRLITIVLLAFLTGCAVIPPSGPLEVIDTQVEADDEFVRVIVKPPAPGMSELDIVQGFITSISDASDNYAIARQYLAADVSALWAPEEILVFDSSSVEFSLPEVNRVEVRGSAVGAITKFNRLRIFEQTKSFSYTFKLDDINSEKRITRNPDVTLISYGNLIRSYSGYSLYFVDAALEYLTPEAIWLPDFSSGIETRLVREVFAGPKSQLKTAIPDALELEFNSVGFEDNFLTVRLRYSSGSSAESQRNLYIAQLVWTLTQLPDIDVIRVYLNSQPVRVNNTIDLSRSLFNQFTQERTPNALPLFVSASDSLLRGDESGVTEISQIAPLSSMAISKDLAIVAGVRGQRAFVATNLSFSNPLQIESDVRSVEFDNRLRLWMVMQQGGVRVWLANSNVTRPVALPDNRNVISFSPASDAARAAIVLETPSGGQLRLGDITQQGSTLRIIGYRKVERFFADVYDVDWINTNELAVLGRVGVEQPEIYVLNVTTGDIKRLGGPSGITEVFSGFELPIYVLSQFGQYWMYTNGEWVLQGEAFALALVG